MPSEHWPVVISVGDDEAPPADLPATARHATESAAVELERTGVRNVERFTALAQAAALASIAESLADARAAAVAAMPGVLRTLEATGKALSGAYSGQTAALQRIADALEASGLVVDIETNDLEALTRSADGDSLFVHVDPAAGVVSLTHTVDDRSLAVAVNGDVRPEVMPRDRAVFELLAPDEHTKHGAERLRMRLDRLRELVEQRIITTNWMTAQEILAILDDPEAGDD